MGTRKSAGDFHWKYLYDYTKKDGTVILGAISLGFIPEEIINQLQNTHYKEETDAVQII